MSDLLINMAELNQMWGNLCHVANTFNEIDAVDKSLHDAVGRHDMQSAVGGFGNGWDIRRKAISQALDAMWQSAEVVHTAFRTADTDLANALNEK